MKVAVIVQDGQHSLYDSSHLPRLAPLSVCSGIHTMASDPACSGAGFQQLGREEYADLRSERAATGVLRSQVMMSEEQRVNAIRQMAHTDVVRAIELLSGVMCPRERRSLASFIAVVWSRKDINSAWNAVSSSKLSASEKQTLFNELWS